MHKFFTNLLATLFRPAARHVATATFGKRTAALCNIHVFTGDITKMTVDVIVNAANSTLLGGGGVDGAIHRAAGPALLEYCRTLNGCAPGDVKGSPGFALPAKFVLHAVGPDTRVVTDQGVADRMLEDVYRKAMGQAVAMNSIAFPAISCGIFGFEPQRAARIAVRVIGEALEAAPWLTVYLVAFDDKMAEVLSQALNRERVEAAMNPIALATDSPNRYAAARA